MIIVLRDLEICIRYIDETDAVEEKKTTNFYLGITKQIPIKIFVKMFHL